MNTYTERKKLVFNHNKLSKLFQTNKHHRSGFFSKVAFQAGQAWLFFPLAVRVAMFAGSPIEVS